MAYPAASLPPWYKTEPTLLHRFHIRPPRLDLPAGRQESGRYGSQGWPPLRGTAANPDGYTWSAELRFGTRFIVRGTRRAGGRSSLSYAPASRRSGDN